jgi:hypothetical protein
VAGLVIAITASTVTGAEDVAKSPDEETHDELGLSLSTSTEYSEGKYGTGHTTQILYVPSTLTWSATDRLELKLTIPYVWEHGRNIFAVAGVRAPQRVQVRQASRGTQGPITEDGLGDILVEGNYVLLQEKDVIPELTAVVEVKCPTADSRRGLGTGEFDETLGVNLTKTFGERWTGEADMSYTFVGSPPHTSLQNSFGWSLGLSYAITGSLRLASFVEGATPYARRSEPPLDLRLQAETKLSKMVEWVAEATVGLSHNSPDFSVSTRIKISF